MSIVRTDTCSDMANIEKGLERIERFFNGLVKQGEMKGGGVASG